MRRIQALVEFQKLITVFRTKNKKLDGVGLQNKPFLMSAGGEELSAFVES